MRVRAQATVDPVDHRSIARVVPELIRCWGELRFDNGVVVLGTTGERREGLQVVEGVHPHVGTKYRVVIVDMVPPALTDAEHGELKKLTARRKGRDAALGEWVGRRRAELESAGRLETKTTTLLVEVLANDAEALRLRFTWADRSQLRVDVTLEHPGAPRAASCDLAGRSSAPLIRGAFAGEGRMFLDRLPPPNHAGPQASAGFRHRDMRASATVRVREGHDDRWEVAVGIRARGAGLVRPMAAIVAPLVARAVRRQLRTAMAALPDRVERFNRDWRSQIARAGVRGVAQQWLDEFLSALPASVPERG